MMERRKGRKKSYKYWGTKEKERLRELFPKYTNKELAEIFGRTYRSIACQCSLMGLKRRGVANEV